MKIDDRLEHDIKLSDLVNEDSLRNLVQEFSSFHGLELRVTQPDRTVLCDSTTLAGGAGRDVALPPVPESSDKFTVVSDGDRGDFLFVRIENQFESIGYIVLGPFVDGEHLDGEPVGGEPVGGEPVGGAGIESGPARASGEHVTRVGHLLCTVLQEVAFANYQSYLYAKMQLQVSSEHYGDLVGRDAELAGLEDAEAERKKHEETLLESGDFTTLF